MRTLENSGSHYIDKRYEESLGLKMCEELQQNEGPSLALSDFGEQNLSELKDDLKEQGGGVLVVRCWNKTEDELTHFLSQVETLITHTPAIKGVVVSINNNEDSGETLPTLQKLAAEYSFPIVPVLVNGYTWTSGLNGPVALLSDALSDEVGGKVNVVNMSFDVSVDESELKNFSTGLKKGIAFSVRKDSEDDVGGQTVPEDAKSLLKKLLIGKYQISEEDQKKIILAFRNTLSIFPLQDIVRLGGFNPNCNGKNGLI